MIHFRNNGEKMSLGGYIIEVGINYLPADFKFIVESDKKLLKKWSQLVKDGVIEFL